MRRPRFIYFSPRSEIKSTREIFHWSKEKRNHFEGKKPRLSCFSFFDGSERSENVVFLLRRVNKYVFRQTWMKVESVEFVRLRKFFQREICSIFSSLIVSSVEVCFSLCRRVRSSSVSFSSRIRFFCKRTNEKNSFGNRSFSSIDELFPIWESFYSPRVELLEE